MDFDRSFSENAGALSGICFTTMLLSLLRQTAASVSLSWIFGKEWKLENKSVIFSVEFWNNLQVLFFFF